jgi:hypothetical protein
MSYQGTMKWMRGCPYCFQGFLGTFFKFGRARFVLIEKRGLQRDKAPVHDLDYVTLLTFGLDATTTTPLIYSTIRLHPKFG